MRKFILIAAMVLVSANAYAGQSRSLILASNDEQPLAAPQSSPAPAAPQTTTTTTTETPKYVERPAAVAPATTAPATTPTATTDTPKTTKAADTKADKAKKRRDTEARVIYELHRHGIYW
jgi:hypothetical protein